MYVDSFKYSSKYRSKFTKYECMTIFDLYTYHVCVFMYKINNDLCPGYLSSLFTMEQSNFIYNIRSYNEKNVKIPFPSIKHYKKSLLFSGSTLWNSFPNNLKNTDSLYDFKHMLKSVFYQNKHLITNLFNILT